jgi:hypothetical protein
MKKKAYKILVYLSSWIGRNKSKCKLTRNPDTFGYITSETFYTHEKVYIFIAMIIIVIALTIGIFLN